MSLCHRCEHRAVFLEKGHGPRCECKDTGRSVFGCYMYQPVRPCVLQRREGDSRPLFAGAMFSARARFVRIAEDADIEARARPVNGGYLPYWTSRRARSE